MAEESTKPRQALFCDTNVLVRLLSGEPAAQADRAAVALDDPSLRLVLTDVVIAELAYVLVGQAKMSHAEAADQIRAILDLSAVEVADADLLDDALGVWASTRIDFADAYLAALNRSTLGTGVLSFDRDLDKVEGVLRVEPGKRQP